MNTPSAQRPKRSFSKPFNPIGAIVEYLHIVIAVTLIGSLVSIPYVILKKKPRYGTEGIMNINPNMPKILYRVEESSFIHSFEDWMRTQVKVMTSYPVMEWAILDYQSQGFQWQLPGETMVSAVARLNARIKIVQIRDTQLITLSMEDGTDKGLAEIVNSVIKGYVNSIDSYGHNQDAYKLEILAKERRKVQKALDDGYRDLEEVSRKYGTAITEEKNLYIYFESLADLKKTYNKMVTDRILAGSRMRALTAKGGTLKGMPLSGMVADRVDSGLGLAALITQISGRIQDGKEQMTGLTEDNPRKILLKRRQQEMEAQVARLQKSVGKYEDGVVRGKLLDENQLAIESSRADYRTSVEAEKLMLRELDRAQKEILEYNTAVLRAQTKRQDIQRFMDSLTRINERTDQIRLEFASPGRVTVTSWAMKPEGPNLDPSGKLIPVCLIVSLLAGVGVALVREMSDGRIKRPRDVEKLLGFPLTGFLLRAEDEKIPQENLYALYKRNPRSFMTQQLAEMVVKMDRERLEHDSKVFAFTGVGDGCGVTMLAVNLLAMSSVPRNRRLYIDLNTRAPFASGEPLKSIMKDINGGNLSLGFSDDAHDELPFAFYPSAAAMHEGRAHSSEDLKTLLEVLKNSFDMIVIDLPPILLSADSQAIVGVADVVVLAALARHSLWGELTRSVTMLDDCGVKVMSVVLNRVGFIRGEALSKNLQAYLVRGRARKSRLFGKG